MTLLSLTGARAEDAYARALSMLISGLRADRAAIVYLSGSALQLACAHGLPPFDMSDPAISESVLREAIESDRNVVYNDIKGDYQARGNLSLHLSGAVSVLCIPFYDEQSRPVGALYADTVKRPAAFHRRELHFARDCASWLESLLAGRSHVPPPELEDAVAGRTQTDRPPQTENGPRARPSARGPLRRETRTEQVSTGDLMVVFRSLAALTQAGVMIHWGLQAVARSSQKPSTQRVLDGLSEAVGQGEPLSLAMESYPKTFPDHLCSAVRIGERSGRLVHVLDVLARDLEKGQRLTYRLRSALTYPALLAGGCLLMLLFGPPYLLAGQLQVLSESGMPLPFLTRALVGLSKVTSQPVFLGLFGLPCALVLRWVATPPGRLRLWIWGRKLPLLGPIIQHATLARFAGTLALQLRAGLTLFEALHQARKASTDPDLVSALSEAEQGLRDGLTLTEALARGGYFSRTFLGFVEAGEASGTLVKLTEWLALFYEREVEADLERFVAASEPLLMAAMGCFTTLLLVATLRPTISVLQTL